jgi:hypothetical protein
VSDENLEQWTDIKTHKSCSETWLTLTLAMKKSSVLECRGGSRKGSSGQWAVKNAQHRCKCAQGGAQMEDQL